MNMVRTTISCIPLTCIIMLLPKIHCNQQQTETNALSTTSSSLRTSVETAFHTTKVTEKQGTQPAKKPIPVIFSLEAFCKIIKVNETACKCSNPMFKTFPLCIKPMVVIHKTVILYDATIERPRAVCTTVAAFLGIVGNSLVLFMSFKNRRILSKCKFLVAVLAGCDLLFAVMQLITDIPVYWTAEWIYGVVPCKVLISGNTMGSVLAIGIILIIAIDRYTGIIHPFGRGLSKRIRLAMLMVNLLWGLSMAIPLSVVLTVDRKKCREMWSNTSSLIYGWTNLIVFFVVPAIAITALYSKIIHHLRIQVNCPTGIAASDASIRQKKIKDNKRIMKILISIFISFVVLVLPNKLIWVVMDHVGTSNMSRDVYRGLKYFALIPYSFHVMVNPIVYSLVDRNLQRRVSGFFSRTTTKFFRIIGRNKSESASRDTQISYSLESTSGVPSGSPYQENRMELKM